MEKKKALLILSHQGQSYIELIHKKLAELGVACLVVTSKPRNEKSLALLKKHSEHCWVLEGDNIDQESLFSAMDEASSNFSLLSVLASFEGYRLLMSKANERIDAYDSSTHALSICMDKYQCRNVLIDRCLSATSCTLIDQSSFIELSESDKAYFIKPRRGAGSFACFPMSGDITYEDLLEIKNQMKSDRQFRQIFNGEFDFIAEDYICGDEYSFETIIVDGSVYVLGVHAKYVEESNGTTLEMSNSLPAPLLSNEEQRTGEMFITRCVEALHLENGALHIETRYDSAKKTWEIIEVNARMGGALINQSVEVFTNGYSILDLWIESLCSTDKEKRKELKEKLSKLTESYRRKNNAINNATVFVSRYGLPGKKLTHLSTSNIKVQPDIVHIPVEVGTTLPDSQRGIFLCNALWRVNIEDLKCSIETLPKQFDKDFEVLYS
ncbi:acetyl-CoA carboxylase biotin carboxylase subunit family protein [Vibrio lentus]